MTAGATDWIEIFIRYTCRRKCRESGIETMTYYSALGRMAAVILTLPHVGEDGGPTELWQIVLSSLSLAWVLDNLLEYLANSTLRYLPRGREKQNLRSHLYIFVHNFAKKGKSAQCPAPRKSINCDSGPLLRPPRGCVLAHTSMLNAWSFTPKFSYCMMF